MSTFATSNDQKKIGVKVYKFLEISLLYIIISFALSNQLVLMGSNLVVHRFLCTFVALASERNDIISSVDVSEILMIDAINKQHPNAECTFISILSYKYLLYQWVKILWEPF